MSGQRYRRPDKIIVYLYRRPAPGAVEYLLMQRHPSSRSGAIWQTVVGSAKWDERLVEAARREVFEETGLTRLQGITAVGYAFSFDFMARGDSDYAPGVTRISNTVFAAEVVTDKPIVLSPEHVDHGWYAYGEALGKIYWAQEREALVRLHPMVLSGSVLDR
jgi:8-oxo-dGTP pyrophosphatase MutT (NUDIX family)